jgi:hypothetical protein
LGGKSDRDVALVGDRSSLSIFVVGGESDRAFGLRERSFQSFYLCQWWGKRSWFWVGGAIVSVFLSLSMGKAIVMLHW